MAEMVTIENVINRLEHAIGPAAWRIGGGVVVIVETIQDAIDYLNRQKAADELNDVKQKYEKAIQNKDDEIDELKRKIDILNRRIFELL